MDLHNVYIHQQLHFKRQLLSYFDWNYLINMLC